MLKISLLSWLIIFVILLCSKVNVHCMAHSNNKISINLQYADSTDSGMVFLPPSLPPPMYVCRHHLRRLYSDGRTSTLKLNKDCHLRRPSQLLMSMQGPHQLYSRRCQSQHTPRYGEATRSYLEIGEY